MTEERLAELEQLEQAAKKKPHSFAIDTAARNGLPELLAEVRRLRACREALRLCLAEYVEEYGSASCDCEEPDCWVRKAVEALEDTE